MNFQESVDYLYGLGYELSVKKFGLENTIRLLAALKNPEKNFPKIQIAGTNGKGSVCAFLDSICVTARIKTGLYTSPHLVSITERIKVGGVEISEKDFARHATVVRKASEKLVETGELEALPTFFEQVTAIALNYFAEQNIELAILETGLGGRFDSTTATNAEIVALTPIDLDHQDILGNSLAEITAEKAAIIRQETTVIVAPQKEKAKEVILEKCRAVGVEPMWATGEIQIVKHTAFELFTALSGSFSTENENYTNVTLGLAGRHQFTNAALAVRIAEALRAQNFTISANDISEGLRLAEHAGRLEFFQGVLLDGAHNAAGARAFREYLDEFIRPPLTMIFGAMRDKDLPEIAAALFPKAEHLIFTKVDNPRSMETEELIEFVPQNFDRAKVYRRETVEEALRLAANCAAGGIMCVTGSLYLVGEARKLLNNGI